MDHGKDDKERSYISSGKYYTYLIMQLLLIQNLGRNIDELVKLYKANAVARFTKGCVVAKPHHKNTEKTIL